jgi:hypothetical protein
MFDLFGRKAKAENQLIQAINDGLRGVVWEQRDKIEALEAANLQLRKDVWKADRATQSAVANYKREMGSKGNAAMRANKAKAMDVAA